MAPKDRIYLSEELGKLLSEAGTVDFMRAALEGALNMLMQLEVDASAGADRYERSESRTARHNSARMRGCCKMKIFYCGSPLLLANGNLVIFTILSVA
jgi:hypothetical protein